MEKSVFCFPSFGKTFNLLSFYSFSINISDSAIFNNHEMSKIEINNFNIKNGN